MVGVFLLLLLLLHRIVMAILVLDSQSIEFILHQHFWPYGAPYGKHWLLSKNMYL